ncbi:hypothetical protein BJX66DRAFT_193186 [Aspergillus keveii]|uniref:Uncharacterized protein n=1 Tax=Aspergillus keveii TaxID=714993 RepID=A0ABR4G6A5_9EURO
MTSSCLCCMFSNFLSHDRQTWRSGPQPRPPCAVLAWRAGQEMLHCQTVFAAATRPEKYILTTRIRLLCVLSLTAGDRPSSKNSPDAPEPVRRSGGLHVKGSKIGHVLSAVPRKWPHEFIPRLQSPEMNGEEKTGKGSCCGAAEVSGRWSRDRIWGGGKSRR